MPPTQQLKSSLPPKKKQKTSTNESIKVLERTIVAAAQNGTSLNPLADLLAMLSNETDPKTTHALLFALYRSFVTVIKSGKLRIYDDEPEEAAIVRTWLESRINDFGKALASLYKDEEHALRMAALDISMSLLTHLSTAISEPQLPRLYVPHFQHIIRGLLICPPSSRNGSNPESGQGSGRVEFDVREKFLETHLSVHDDIRWFFLRETKDLLFSTTTQTQHTGPNALGFLEGLMTMPTVDEELNSFWIKEFTVSPFKKNAVQKDKQTDFDEDDLDNWQKFFEEPEEGPERISNNQKKRSMDRTIHSFIHSLKSHRTQFSNCWLALIPHLASSPKLSARALGVLHRAVLPHFTRPDRLMDWIGGCVDFGGSISLLALNALFTLMKDYNLDYPDFYTRLYTFLDSNILHLKHRARFFRLTELFLSSSHLPAQLLASFVKRLSRLSLFAPPAGIVMVIPFVYNLLKKHPVLMVMIHQDYVPDYEDPFDPEEPNPLLTNAISSSLWELASLQHHYLETVSTLAKLYTTPFTKPPFLMEDFLDHTYTTLFETETKRSFKKDPAMILELKKDGLFPPQRASGVDEDVMVHLDAVSELWTFS